jgi:hypothetical protein
VAELISVPAWGGADAAVLSLASTVAISPAVWLQSTPESIAESLSPAASSLRIAACNKLTACPAATLFSSPLIN